MKKNLELSKLIGLAKTTRHRLEILSAVESGPTNLMGYCGIAASYLESLAAKNNIPIKFISGTFNKYIRYQDTYTLVNGHCWLEYNDYIIDTTATQFRSVKTKVNRDFSKKIYLSKSSNPHYKLILSGDEAKDYVRTWYVESLEELCEKIDSLI